MKSKPLSVVYKEMKDWIRYYRPNPIRFIRRKLRRLKYYYQWWKIVRNDHWFDWTYIYRILAGKLHLQADYFEKYGISANAEDCAMQIRKCAFLCEKIAEAEQHDPAIGWENGATEEWRKEVRRLGEILANESLCWWD